MKIPFEWFHLFKGDRIHCRQPYNVVRKATDSMASQGWTFDLEASERGFWLICTESPLVSPHKPDTAA